MGKDLNGWASNVATESLGIALTVLIIERVLAMRNDADAHRASITPSTT